MSTRFKRRWRRFAQLPQRWLERLRRFGKRLASPVEEFSERSVEKVSTLADSFEKLESRALESGRGILRPFKFLARLPQRLLHTVVSPRRLQAIGKPFRRTLKRTQRAFVWLAEALFIDRFFVLLAQLTKPLWYPVAAIGGFARDWWRTRQVKRLLWSIPLLVLSLPLLLAVGWVALWGRSGIAANYRAAIADAQARRDYARLQLWERKLVQLGVDTRRTEFLTVLSLERDGKLEEAYARARQLVRSEGGEFAPAHVWLVEHLLAKELPVPAEETRRLVDEHLRALDALGVKNTEIEIMRALYLSQERRLPEAATVLAPLVERSPIAAVERFRIDRLLGQPAEARRDALAIREHLERQRRHGTALTGADYAWWVEAEKFLDNPLRTRDLLLEWRKAEPQNTAARKDLAHIYLAEFDELLKSPQPDANGLAQRLQDAFALAEVSENVKARVAVLYQQSSAVPVLRDVFDQLARSQELPASLAEVLGTAAGVQEDWQRAEVWLRQAVARDANNGVAWNNLACILLEKGDAALAEALTDANRAVAIAGEDCRFRETRGQILLRLNHPQEAVSDLEFALNGMPDVPGIHRSLAAAYEALGNQQLAAQHRNQSH